MLQGVPAEIRVLVRVKDRIFVGKYARGPYRSIRYTFRYDSVRQLQLGNGFL